MAKWYYIKSGKTLGPVSADQIKQMALSGDLSPDDQVRPDSAEQWYPAKEVKGLSFSATLPGRARRLRSRGIVVAGIAVGAVIAAVAVVLLVVLPGNATGGSENERHMAILKAEGDAYLSADKPDLALAKYSEASDSVGNDPKASSQLRSTLAEIDSQVVKAKMKSKDMHDLEVLVKTIADQERTAYECIGKGNLRGGIETYRALMDTIRQSRVRNPSLDQIVTRVTASLKAAEEHASKAEAVQSLQTQLESARAEVDKWKRAKESAIPASQPAAKPEAIADNPATSYELFTKRFAEALKQDQEVVWTGTVNAKQVTEKVKIQLHGEWGIDLKKTDSLISPYVGVFEFDGVTYINGEPTRYSGSLGNTPVLRKYRVTFVSQGGKWILGDVKIQSLIDRTWYDAMSDGWELPILGKAYKVAGAPEDKPEPVKGK